MLIPLNFQPRPLLCCPKGKHLLIHSFILQIFTYGFTGTVLSIRNTTVSKMLEAQSHGKRGPQNKKGQQCHGSLNRGCTMCWKSIWIRWLNWAAERVERKWHFTGTSTLCSSLWGTKEVCPSRENSVCRSPGWPGEGGCRTGVAQAWRAGDSRGQRGRQSQLIEGLINLLREFGLDSKATGSYGRILNRGVMWSKSCFLIITIFRALL